MPCQKEKDTKGLLMEVEGSKLRYHTGPQGIYPAPAGPVGISPATPSVIKKRKKKKKRRRMDTSKSKIKL